MDKYFNGIDTAMTAIRVIFIVGIILHNILIMNFNNDFRGYDLFCSAIYGCIYTKCCYYFWQWSQLYK